MNNKDLLPYEMVANRLVVVPDNRIPAAIPDQADLEVDRTPIRPEMIVTPQWVKANMGRKNVLVVDARPDDEFSRYHIPGALQLDPMRGQYGLRAPWGTKRPAQLVAPSRLARIIGNTGISDTDHIIAYGYTDWRPGMLLSVLDYLGAPRISFMEGGIKVWRELGYPTTTEPTPAHRKTFIPHPHPEFLADNAFVRSRLDDPETVIVDTRSLDFPNGLSTHARAEKSGHIPGAVKLPFSALYMDRGELKPPEELLYMLQEQGITRDKSVILTSDTGALAGAAFFMLRYLGYPRVRVHDASWVVWSMDAQ